MATESENQVVQTLDVIESVLSKALKESDDITVDSFEDYEYDDGEWAGVALSNNKRYGFVINPNEGYTQVAEMKAKDADDD